MSNVHSFQAEVQQLLNLVIHSLYSHKEIFLRELVSNASDALDKLRFRAITEPELLADGSPLEVRIVPDREKGTLTLEDTGVGMTREELIKNLGTIAHSGSREFLEQMAQKGQKDVNLIGQFGVGFYSAYLVADRVEVVSRAAGATEAHRWISDAKGTFSVEPADRKERGTSVILYLKDEQKEFLEPWRLRDLVTRYSDYVSHSIKLEVEKKWETINRASALWQRPKGEISDEQAEEFYKHLTHDFEKPAAWTHFKAEGSQVFVGLLFVPKVPPFDLHTREHRGIRLYVKRVMVMESCEELLPQWLRFVRGVVDSEDLPLNVSRELLQDSAIVRSIKKQVVKKVLDLLEKVAKDRPADYAELWKGFGVVLKEGLALEPEYKERLAPLLRYESTRDAGLTSLADYVGRMGEGQKAIYYAYGESQKALAGSPHLETLRQRGFEVLYLTDPVDEWAVQGLGEFQGKPLVSAMQAELKLEETDAQKKVKEEQGSALKGLTDRFLEVLKDKVKEVRISDRLTDSPVCLVVPEGGTHAFMEQLLKERGKALPRQKRILELNPGHPLIQRLNVLQGAKVAEWIEVLYDQALLTEGSRLEDPNLFARRMTDLLTQAAAHA